MVDFDGLTHAAVLAAFGEPVTYVPSGQPPLPTLRGVFDRNQILVQEGNQAAPSSVPVTRLGLRQRDLPANFAHRPRDRVLVRGATWDVMDAEPDGQGWVHLQLGRIA